MKRKSFQLGSIRLKTRKKLPAIWVFRYREGGEHKAISIGTVEQYPARADAEKAAFPLRATINDQAECVRFHQLATRYEAEEMPARESTKTSYQSNMKRLRDRWDDMRLDEMAKNPVLIENWLRDLKTVPVGIRVSRPIAAKTKKNIKGLLHVIFERAMAWGYVPVERNPIDLVRVKDAPGVLRTKKVPRTVLTQRQLESLFTDSELPAHVRVMIEVAICTGLRASEILGLRWENVNFPERKIAVEISVVGKHRDVPKTEYSQAEVPIADGLANVLVEWQSHLPSVNGWVFANPVTGRPYWRDSIQNDHLKPAGKRIGVNDLGWHTFRHTYRAMVKLQEGATLEVQQHLMRHSDIRMTLHYGKGPMLEVLKPVNEEMVKKLPLKCLIVAKPVMALTRGTIENGNQGISSHDNPEVI